MNMAQLETLMERLCEKKFRAAQVYGWLCKGARPNDMRNLPQSLRDKLLELPYGGSRIHTELTSKKDGTKKYLFELEDGNIVEGVLMNYHYGNTLCISSQVGCRMGCAFCASTLNGKARDLSAGEMLSFVAEVEKHAPKPVNMERAVTNIVMMGSGEPLDNYDNTVAFLKLVTSQEGMRISPRNISVSTCGVVPKIYEFILDAPHVTLSVSLHAPNDDIRNELMPINNAYPMAQLLPAAKKYADATGRRVVFEYALIKGKNASMENARELASRLKGINCHVNLIPLNSVKERQLDGVTRAEAEEFNRWLSEYRVSATVRREMGTDIDGACGQLRNRVISERERAAQ